MWEIEFRPQIIKNIIINFEYEMLSAEKGQ